MSLQQEREYLARLEASSPVVGPVRLWSQWLELQIETIDGERASIESGGPIRFLKDDKEDRFQAPLDDLEAAIPARIFRCEGETVTRFELSETFLRIELTSSEITCFPSVSPETLSFGPAGGGARYTPW
ncbi:hypothetical protein [Pontivivens ytuae]|uniref:Uncharacterized protein n=1 Tax=Pontivivens ytuae TaxID=2789856 RepID=A0A7S9QEB5_9RHOB|nr:hypothetical protein [Pontivivens ytuae]QPH55222.1 hypothetical protein I0K15_05635 [Pontivivens ytuae]